LSEKINFSDQFIIQGEAKKMMHFEEEENPFLYSFM
jgi:hypothetical protein